MLAHGPLRLALAAAALAAPVHAQDRPDIVVILADDMGYSDLGCYGGEIHTPRLDRLAADGLRFSQFYNGARCCPTRAALLTGLYAHQAGVGHMLSETGLPGYTGGLNDRCRTIAEVLGAAGYRTAMAGKWHVTRHVAPNGDQSGWPRQRGFDHFYGTIIGAGSFYDPATLCRENTFVTPDNDSDYRPPAGEPYYYTHAISEHAVRAVRDHAARTPDRPLFLYVAYTAAHWPMHALPGDIARYRGTYEQGYAAVRARRLARLQQLGLVAADAGLSPQAEGWDAVPEAQRAWEARCMAVYAAMVTAMDRGIGDIVDALRDTGRLDNTLVLFLQDNGGCAENMGRGPRRKPYAEYRPLDPDDLQREIWPPMQTRDGRPVRSGPEVMPGAEDTYVAYGRGWANVSNTPFREYKHWVHEGGIATPLIAHWPAGIPADRRGEVEHQPGHVVDVMATCVDVAGADYPAEHQGVPTTPLQGVSLRPAFAGAEVPRDDALYWEHEGNRAVRDGRWKLVCKGSTRDGSHRPWELYDLARDRAELLDVAAERPELVARLTAQWESWAERAAVWPWPWHAEEEEALSPRRTFRLEPGAQRARDQAPHTTGRGFAITATLSGGGRGVIVAQGGSSDGYALHVDERGLHFSVRHGGALTEVTTAAPTPGQPATIRARLFRDGRMTLQVDDRDPAAGRCPGPVDMPIEGLEVGGDPDGLVGDYGADNGFGGSIRGLMIVLDESKT